MNSIGMPAGNGDDALAPEVRELLDQRASLQKWLIGLEAQRGVTSERILQRVRADYEGRLAATNDALASHVTGIRAEMERAAERGAEAERLHDAAVDALEEARLRHAIGELPGDGWPDREQRLMDDVRSAKIAEDTSRTEVDRLHELLATLTGDAGASDSAAPIEKMEDAAVEAPPSAPPAAAGPPASSPSFPEILSGKLDSEATVESGPAISGPSVPTVRPGLVADAEGKDEDVGPGEAGVQGGGLVGEAPDLFDPDDIPTGEKAPPPGLKCGECGYTNDLSAWFCGVCGADVG